jgi:hypothetical protein
VNGELLDTFEDFFGYLHAWKGYLFNLSCCGDGANPWIRLRSNIVKDLSRRVVSLASFNGEFTVICSFLFCASISSSPANDQSFDV